MARRRTPTRRQIRGSSTVAEKRASREREPTFAPELKALLETIDTSKVPVEHVAYIAGSELKSQGRYEMDEAKLFRAGPNEVHIRFECGDYLRMPLDTAIAVFASLLKLPVTNDPEFLDA